MPLMHSSANGTFLSDIMGVYPIIPFKKRKRHYVRQAYSMNLTNLRNEFNKELGNISIGSFHY